MHPTLYTLLGGDGTLDADAVGDVSLRLAAPGAGVWVIVLGIVLAVLAILLYRRSPKDVSPGRKAIMTALRVALFALLAALLLQPVLSLELLSNRKKTLAVALDTSTSFDIADNRTDRHDAARAAIATGALAADAGLDGPLPPAPAEPLPRSKVAEAALAQLRDALADQLDIVTIPFDQSAIGDAMLEVARRFPADSLAAVLVVSDGNNTTGTAPAAAAGRLRDLGLTAHTYGVGTTDPPDVAVTDVTLPAVALAGDHLSLTARLRTSGMAGQTVRVVATVAGTVAASADLTLTGDPEQAVELSFIPQATGEFPVEVSVESDAAELVATNNSAPASLRVVDTAMKVLIVDQSPRWEFKYIEAMLLREQRVDLDVLLLEADRAVARAPGSPYIDSFPDRAEELFAYDLVIFGDVDPDKLSPDQVALLSDYVARTGGALAIVAGKRYTPAAYRHTDLAPLLPVAVRPAGGRLGTNASTPVRLVPTDAGLATSMLTIHPTVETGSAWRALPPVYWTADVGDAKPAAEVLVERDGGRPVVALQRFGAGEVLFVGTDNTWRWRKNKGDETHTRFWGQVVQRLAGHRLAGGPRHVRIEADRQSYAPGDRLSLLAQINDAAWNPSPDTITTATLQSSDPGTPSRTLTLTPVPDRPGFFRAEIDAPAAGHYTLNLPDTGAAPARFTVHESDPELARLPLDTATMKSIAAGTGGTFVREESLLSLVSLLSGQSATVTTHRELALWSAPLTLILLIALITTEWILRKFAELK